MKKAAISLAMLMISTPLAAQTPRPMLDYASAATIRDTCLAWAAERRLTVAVAVFDESGKLLALAHMDGAASAVGDFAQWKGRSAGLATWEGGLPIFSAAGVALGGVGVSGAESAEDVACGRAGIAAAGLREAAD